MIPIAQLGNPIRQRTQDLCGIAAYVTAARAFCGKDFIDFLHDIWELEPETVEPTDEATCRDFYQVHAPALFRRFEWNGNGVKMFEWLRSLQENRRGPNFRQADLASSLQTYPLERFGAMERHLVEKPAIACVAIAFDTAAGPVCHVVNVLYQAPAFHLRDSDRTGGAVSDGEASSLAQALELTGVRNARNGQITGGMTVTSRFG